jgi:S-adenosylhomocysteine hydrolase
VRDEDLQSTIEAHQRRNASLRDLLITKGVDLTEPRIVECHFWSTGEDNARALAKALEIRGFKIRVLRAARTANERYLWNVETAVKQSPEITMRPEFTDDLVKLASAFESRYDGWGTQV